MSKSNFKPFFIFILFSCLLCLGGLCYGFYVDWLVKEIPLKEVVDLAKVAEYQFQFRQYSRDRTAIILDVPYPESSTGKEAWDYEEYEYYRSLKRTVTKRETEINTVNNSEQKKQRPPYGL